MQARLFRPRSVKNAFFYGLMTGLLMGDLTRDSRKNCPYTDKIFLALGILSAVANIPFDLYTLYRPDSGFRIRSEPYLTMGTLLGIAISDAVHQYTSGNNLQFNNEASRDRFILAKK